MRTIRRMTLGLAGAVAASVTLAAGAHAQTPKKGGILNAAVVAEPPNYDCHAQSTFGLSHPISPHYSTLLKYSGGYKETKIVGDLADSWTVSPDGLTYTFKLHKNVKFHDGSPMTSADVKATYERIAKPPAGVVSLRQPLYEDIATIETPDDHTVVFKLKSKNASMFDSLASP